MPDGEGLVDPVRRLAGRSVRRPQLSNEERRFRDFRTRMGLHWRGAISDVKPTIGSPQTEKTAYP